MYITVCHYSHRFKIFIFNILSILSLSFYASSVLALEFTELVERDGLAYLKFSDIPFSGTVSGAYQGEYINGLRNGNWLKFHENGQLHEKGLYVSGAKHEAWKEYSDNGKVVSLKSYSNGLLHGKSTDFYNGSISRETQFQHGVALEYLDYTHDEGKLESVIRKNTNFERNGESIWYYGNGNKRIVETYKNGKLHGSVKSFDYSGKLTSETAYEFGLREGYHISHYNNEIRTTQYSQGKKNGEEVIKDTDGNLLSRSNYVHNELHGKSFSTKAESWLYDITGTFLWYDDGSIIEQILSESLTCEAMFSNGKFFGTASCKDENNLLRISVEREGGNQHPILRAWYSSGQLATKLTFGEKIVLVEYWENGNLNSEREFSSTFVLYAHGEHRHYGSNGRLVRIYNFAEEKLEGSIEYFGEDGQTEFFVKIENDFFQNEFGEPFNGTFVQYNYLGEKILQGKVLNGLKEGKFRFFNPEGIWRTETFKAGQLSGERRVFFNSDKDLIREISNFQNGKLNGKQTSFFENGQVKSEGHFKDGERSGYWKFYYENGIMSDSGRYNKDGKKEGIWWGKHPDGSEKFSKTF